MYYFLNDYSDVCIPEILEELKKAIDEKNPGYSFDSHTERAVKLIKNALQDEFVDIHFVTGGTIANVLGSTVGLRDEESVIAATTGHIQGHESGSVEATGKKIETVHTDDGKLTPELLKEKLRHFTTEYMTVPRKVYISNTTELGTLYTKEELQKLYEFCKENNLYLFIDGARMAAALACESSGLKLKDLTKLCDIFTLGGTKNGLMYSEAMVICNDELKRGFLNLKKQKGTMMAKGFIIGIMYEVLFKNGEESYLKGARHAQKMAEILATGLQEKGISLYHKFESNQIFVERNAEELEALRKIATFDVVDESPSGNGIARFVTTYRTIEEEIRGLLNDI